MKSIHIVLPIQNRICHFVHPIIPQIRERGNREIFNRISYLLETEQAKENVGTPNRGKYCPDCAARVHRRQKAVNTLRGFKIGLS